MQWAFEPVGVLAAERDDVADTDRVVEVDERVTRGRGCPLRRE
jgi:hypothetical protein